MSDIIEISHVTKKYGAATVLNDVNISFEKGKIHGLIGRNGSGKTMLMKCICGFVPVTQGSVTVNGKKIGKDIDVPENLGAIIETPGFLNNYSGYNNLKFLAGINKKIGREQIREAISFVGLDPDSKKHVGRYSLGMRQRLGLAQAIMEKPDILILDDSTSAVDTATDAKIRKAFAEEIPNTTKLIIAQRISSVMNADRIIVLNNGVVDGFGSHEELMETNAIYREVYESQTQGSGDFDEGGAK